MTPVEFANKYGLRVVEPGCGEERQIEGAYCGDLLSMVMGRAKENDAFVTVMANVNTIAVAVLADVATKAVTSGSTGIVSIIVASLLYLPFHKALAAAGYYRKR